MSKSDLIDSEIQRINTEYQRREAEIDADLYAPWQPGEIYIVSERQRIAAVMLRKAGKFPTIGDRCLEVGYGKLGWLGTLISWGLREADLYGIELDAGRASKAKQALSGAHLEIGNATQLPWPDGHFSLIIVSTVFSSVLDNNVRALIAAEMKRVLASGGVVLWYDMAVDNPSNPNIKGISKRDLEQIFSDFECHFQSVTLAPPIVRRVATWNWTLAAFLSSLPFLRTHLLAILIKK